ncbi:efflux RND transporter periplasmic adaptor subunit [Synechococcus sp. MIT S1220]|uniref:efflux RND transporter periplasmic adaptor subunit n=1 Tax=Synechococcus sp. MIT S1220 TaxID=3082549 RepID=UPI0039AF6425
MSARHQAAERQFQLVALPQENPAEGLVEFRQHRLHVADNPSVFPYVRQKIACSTPLARFSRRLAFLTTAAAWLILSSCGSSDRKKQTPLTIQTTTVANANFAPVLETISELESVANVDLKPSIDGRVMKILVRDGESVKAGQVILVLDNIQERATLQAAQSEALKDKVNADRYSFLYSQGAVSAKERDRYITEAIQSRDEAQADAATLNYKVVRSPINGVIGNLDSVKVGDYLKTGETITGIVDNSTLWTLMQIPGSQISKVKKGQPVRITAPGNPPITAQGSVVFISPYFDTNNNPSSPNTVTVKAAFPNPNGQLRSGQVVETEIITSMKQNLAVPVQAVMMQAEQPFVYRVVPLRRALPKIKASASTPESTKKALEKLPSNTPIVVETKVELGKLERNLYPVISGLKAGDVVAVSNTVMLRSGMPVKVSNTKTAAITTPNTASPTTSKPNNATPGAATTN